MPNAWRKRVHPRRGYRSAQLTKGKLDKKASAKLVAHLEALRSNLSVKTKRKKDVIAAIDAQVSGESTQDSELAAAICALAYYRVEYDGKAQPIAVVDHFVSNGGLAFAVDVVLHSVSLCVGLKTKKVWTPQGEFVLQDKSDAAAASFDAPEFFHIANDIRPALFRLRTLLAVCPEPEHAAAFVVAKAHRKKDKSLAGFVRCVAASYLFEGVREWVEEDVRTLPKAMKKHANSDARSWCHYHVTLILACLRTLEEYEALNELVGKSWPESPWDMTLSGQHGAYAGKRWYFMPTLLEGLGAQVLTLCSYLYDYAEKADYISPLAYLDDDAAFTALMDRADAKHPMAALSEAAVLFPKRGVRLLSERVQAKGKNHGRLSALIEAAQAATAKDHEAPRKKSTPKKKNEKTKTAAKTTDSTPHLLANPPWERAKTKFRAQALAPIPYKATFAWADGEKDEFWLQRWDPGALEYSERFPFPGGYLERIQQGDRMPQGHWKIWSDEDWLSLSTDWEKRFTVAHAPEHLSWDEAQTHVTHPKYFYAMGTAIVRHGERLLPQLIEQAKRHPKEAWVHLGPFDCAELAAPLASVLHVKKLRADVERWFIRHPRAAAFGLIPNLLGKESKARKAAALALKAIARRNAQIIVEVAREYGDDVASQVEEMLADDPRLSKQPKKPNFWSSALPRPRLKSGDDIDDGAFDNLRIYLMLSEIEDPLPGLYEVLGAFDEDSLATFGLALFDAWERAGFPNGHRWVMSVQGFVGNDDTARRLTPLVRKWPGESSHVRATHGLEALAAIGSDLALMGIYDIGQRLKFKALKELASSMVKAIAADRGLREEELADRLVPSLGLDEMGILNLDFGPRKFVVRFDEALKVDLRDVEGKKLKTLPKPNTADDAAKAKEAKKTLAALKKDAKAIAGAQISRLEKSMTTGRRWSGENFLRFFARHPLIRHLAQRLVWATYKDGEVLRTFRPTDEGAVTASDEAFSIESSDEVGLLHPIDAKSAELAAWGSALGDFEIVQPFAQLGRSVYDMAATLALLDELRGARVPTSAVLQLRKSGWSRGEPQDSGHISEMTRGACRLALAPGFNVAAVAEEPEQTAEGLFLEGKAMNKALLSSLSRIDQSELAWSLRVLV